MFVNKIIISDIKELAKKYIENNKVLEYFKFDLL